MEYNPTNDFSALSEDLDETMNFGQISPTSQLQDDMMALFNQSDFSALAPFDIDNLPYDTVPQASSPLATVSELSPSVNNYSDEDTTSKKSRKPSKKARTVKSPVAKGVDDKYRNRLEANKKSAQQSRERKKNLKVDLEATLSTLTTENTQLSREIIEMETENRVLKGEFIQLQNMISESAVLSKMMDRITSMNIPYPTDPIKPAKDIAANSTPDLFSNAVDPTALMYMMIVMQSFNQYFTNNNNNPNAQWNGLGMAPTVA